MPGFWHPLQASVHREGIPAWGIVGQPPRPWFLPGGVELTANPSSDLWRLCCPCGQQNWEWGAGLSHRHERTERWKDQCWWGQKGVGEGRQGPRLALVIQAQMTSLLLPSSILLSWGCSCVNYPYPRAPQGPETVWSAASQKPGKTARFCIRTLLRLSLGPPSLAGLGGTDIPWRTLHCLNQNVCCTFTCAFFQEAVIPR